MNSEDRGAISPELGPEVKNAEAASAPPDFGAPRDGRVHIPALDGLRGLAIVLVMMLHFTGGSDPGARGLAQLYARVVGCGWCGVDLFFVLSGFLITGILCDTRHSPTYLRDFFARRALRIFPLYYGVLAALFVVLPRCSSPVLTGMQNLTEHQAWLWTYTSNIGMFFKGPGLLESGSVRTAHFWSLAVEEQFYFLWPFAVLLFRREILTRLCLMCIILAVLLRCVLARSGFDGAQGLMPCRLDGLMGGAFVALSARSVRGISALVPGARLVGLLSGTVLAILFTVAGLEQGSRITLSIGYILLSAFFSSVLVLVLVAPVRSPLGRVFKGRTLRFFGKYSYGLYVWHYLLKPTFDHFFSVNILIDRVFGHYWPARFAYVVLSLAASVAVAWLSWHLFEKHFLGLKRFFEYGRARGHQRWARAPMKASSVPGLSGVSHS